MPDVTVLRSRWTDRSGAAEVGILVGKKGKHSVIGGQEDQLIDIAVGGVDRARNTQARVN